MSSSSTSTEPSSWAEMVQGIDHSRKNLPWDSTKVEPVKRISTYEVSIYIIIFIILYLIFFFIFSSYHFYRENVLKENSIQSQ